MPTLKYQGDSYECAKAIKGADYIHLLDSSGEMIAAFDEITDFSGFTLTSGSYTTPTADDNCSIAVIREDGTIGKSGYKWSDAVSAADHQIESYTSLNQLGLSDANDMSATDAAANFVKIFTAIGSYGFLYTAVGTDTNLSKSIKAKLNADLGITWTSFLDIQCYRTGGVNLQIDVVPQFYAATGNSPYLPANRYSCVLRYTAGSISYLSPFTLTRSLNGFINRAGDTIPGAVLGMLDGMVKFGAYTNMLQLSAYNTIGVSALSSHLQLMSGAPSSLMTLVTYDKDGKRADYPVLHLGNIGSNNIGRIVTGSYVGTGTKGVEGKNSISLSFAPKLVIVSSEDSHPSFFIRGATKALTWGGELATGANVTLSWTNTGVEWWLEEPVLNWMWNESWNDGTLENAYATEQLNKSGKTYNYVAIG